MGHGAGPDIKHICVFVGVEREVASVVYVAAGKPAMVSAVFAFHTTLELSGVSVSYEKYDHCVFVPCGQSE